MIFNTVKTTKALNTALEIVGDLAVAGVYPAHKLEKFCDIIAEATEEIRKNIVKANQINDLTMRESKRWYE